MRFLIRKLIIVIFLFVSVPCWGGGQFDGIDDIANNTDINSIDSTSTLSCGVWVYHDTISSDNSLISKTDDLTSFSDGWLLFRDNIAGISGRTDTYKILLFDSGDTDQAFIEGATNASPLQTWTHVAFTVDLGSATGLRLYVNGIEDANSPASTSSIGAIDAGVRGVRFGKTFNSNARQPFDGQITEVNCATVIWTANEVLILGTSRVKRMCLQIQPSSLEFCCPMDEGTEGEAMDGQSLIDISGNNNCGSYFDSTNNTGMTATPETILSYPPN